MPSTDHPRGRDRARALPVALVVALCVLVLVAGVAPAPAGAAEGLTVTGHTQLDDRLHEYTVHSLALEREATVRVHLPTGYDADPERRWPMALLLHGRSENGTTWSDRVDLDQLDGMVLVMPDGGLVGWYTDWVDDTGFAPQRWETFHVGEVLPWAARSFRLAEGRSQRFVAGDSMGGYGAMAYAATYPDLFGGAAELSGFVDLLLDEVSGSIGVDGQSFQTYQVQPGQIFGDRLTQEVLWRGNNPVDLAANLAHTDLVLRHGNGLPGEGDSGPDAGEAAIRLTGVSLHDTLDALDVPHRWDDYGNGVHTWPYWSEGLMIAFPRWLAIAAAAAPDPTPFSYTTIAPSFEVYGVTVEVTRDVAEFAALTDVGPGGFALRGSGSATITTGPWYVPGAGHAVTIDDATSSAVTTTLVADAAGRLTVPVDLGPSHTAQQFTPEADALQAALGDAYFTTAVVTIDGSAAGSGVGAAALGPRTPTVSDATASDGRPGGAATAGLAATGGGGGGAAGALLALTAAASLHRGRRRVAVRP